MTAKIRYIGEEKTTRAFGKTWVRSLWNDKHALPDEHVDILAQNPRFQVVKEGEPEPKDDPKPAAEAGDNHARPET